GGVAAVLLWALALLRPTRVARPAAGRRAVSGRIPNCRVAAGRRKAKRQNRKAWRGRRETPTARRPATPIQPGWKDLDDADREALRTWASALGVLAAVLAARASAAGNQSCALAL